MAQKSGPLLPSRHVETGFMFLFSPNFHIPDRFKDHLSDKGWNDHLCISACASYKSNGSLAFTIPRVILFYIAHLISLSQCHPLPLLLLTMCSRGLTRTVVKASYLTPGVSFTVSRFSSSISDAVKQLTVYFFLPC